MWQLEMRLTAGEAGGEVCVTVECGVALVDALDCCVCECVCVIMCVCVSVSWAVRACESDSIDKQTRKPCRRTVLDENDGNNQAVDTEHTRHDDCTSKMGKGSGHTSTNIHTQSTHTHREKHSRTHAMYV